MNVICKNNKKMKTVLLIIILLLTTIFSFGQDTFIQHERKLIDNGYFGDALILLLKHNTSAKTFDQKYRLYFKIAECYYFLQNFEKEAEYNEKIYLLDKKDTEAMLPVAEAYQRSGNFEKAIKYFTLYKNKGQNPALGEIGIKSCEFAVYKKNNPSNIRN